MTFTFRYLIPQTIKQCLVSELNVSSVGLQSKKLNIEIYFIYSNSIGDLNVKSFSQTS